MGRFLLIYLGCLLALATCGPQPALPTRAAPAPNPPTPQVIVPTPTLAAIPSPSGRGLGRGSEADETGTPAHASAQPTPTGAGEQESGGAGETAAPTNLSPTDSTPISEIEGTANPLPNPLPEGEGTALPPLCDTPGHIEQATLDSAVADQPMRYRIYLPPCYGQDGRVYPTLYLFGGNIHDESFWDTLGIDEAAEAAILAGDIPPLLIVMPDNGWLANDTTSGPTSYEGFVLNELIPHVEQTYCAWPAREGRAVGGVSRGGYWSLMMAFRRPDVFRSVGAHSPALIDSFAGPAEDPSVTGVVNDLGDLRIWIDLGQRDPYLVQAQPLHGALAADGVAHEWRIEPGIHEPAYWQAHLNDYLRWYSAGFPPDRTTLPACANR